MMNARIFFTKPEPEVKLPRWLAWRSMNPNPILTRFIHDAEAGVQWRCQWQWIRGFAARRSRNSCWPRLDLLAPVTVPVAMSKNFGRAALVSGPRCAGC